MKHGKPCKNPELKLITLRFVCEPLCHTFTTLRVLLCLESWVIGKLSVWETSGSFPREIVQMGCLSAKLLSHVRLFMTPMDCSSPGSSVYEILQARILEWVGLSRPPSGHLPDPVIRLMSLMSPVLAGGYFTTGATWEAHKMSYLQTNVRQTNKKHQQTVKQAGNFTYSL